MRQPHLAVSLPLIFLLTIVLFTGCRSSTGSVIEPPETLTGGETPTAMVELLPSPRALLVGQEQARAASAAETDYINYGGNFEAALPNQNALAAPSNSVEFQPSWSEPDNSAASRLAYCIYKFTIPGFDRTAQLRYGWTIAPAEANTVWFGLSDWPNDTWCWLRGQESGMSAIGTAEPYFNATGVLYVAVVCANDDIGVMRYLRVGEMPAADLALSARPRYARPPVSVTGDATGSTMPVGTVESHAWDWDNDGTFEEDTGANPMATSTFTTVGDHTFKVRVTSSYGEQATTSGTTSVINPWTHSWGTDIYQDVGGIVTDGSEFCYVAGSTMRTAAHRDALLLKYSLTGDLGWAKAWGGASHDELEDVEVYQTGVFTVGQTDSYGAGDFDVLLQRWDANGNVVWSRVWGTAGTDRGNALAHTDTALYVVGQTMAMGDMDVLLLKYDFDGNLIWARTWGGAGYDTGADIVAHYQQLQTAYRLYLTGASTSPAPPIQDVLFLEFDEDAATHVERTWRSDTEDSQYGGAIVVTGFVAEHIYIAGSVGAMDEREALLVEVGTGTGNLARGWSNSTESVAYGVAVIGGNMYINGRGWNLGVSSGGFVAEFSPSGSLQNSTFWADGDDNTGITALKAFPGTGFLVGGNCHAANDGAWAGAAGTVTSPGGTWTDYAGVVNVPVESTASPTQAAEDLTGGVVDTGGGHWDTLLSIVEFP